MPRRPENHSTWQPVTLALAGAVRELRLARGLSLHALSNASGLDRKVLRRVESGAERPHADTLDRLACGLGLLASEVLAVAEWRAGLRPRPPAVAVRLRLAGARGARDGRSEIRLVIRLRPGATADAVKGVN